MRVLYLGLWLGTDFFFLNVFPFFMFLIVLLFYKLYIAIINHKQVLCLARKNDSLMILQYSYILIIIFIIKGRWCKKENWWWTWTAHNGISKSSFTNSHFFFLSFASQWFVSPPPHPSDSGYAAQCTAPRSQSQFRPRSLDSRPFKKKLKNNLHVVTLSATAAQRRSM